MAVCCGGDLDVHFYDNKGTKTRSFHATHATFTTRKRQAAQPPSSSEWLKQIYVADSYEGLKQLLTENPMEHEAPPGTSCCSREAMVYIAQGTDRSVLSNQAVIARGDHVPNAASQAHGQGQDQGQDQNGDNGDDDDDCDDQYILATELHVSPVDIADGHPLHALWVQNID